MTTVVPVVDYEIIDPADANRSAPTTPPPRHAPDRTAERASAGFAAGALRVILEVLDKRRPPTHLQPILAPALAASVAAAIDPGPRHNAAVLRRVWAQACGSQSFEVSATYSRGRRLHAIACQIRYSAGRWQLVALQIG